MRPSPLRYPGGKHKLLDQLLPLLTEPCPEVFTDVFVGGGSVLLAVAERCPSTRLMANDLHPNIAALWRVLAAGQDISALRDWVMTVTPSVALFRQLVSTPFSSDLDRACVALYLNRTSYSGIGQRPFGVQDGQYGSRWNAERLCEQIGRCAALLAGRTTVTQAHFSEVAWTDRTYLDPPYVKEGAGLYALGAWTDEHEYLMHLAVGRDGWVVSYDDHPYVRELWSWANIREVPVYYSTGSDERTELLITPP